MDTNTQSKFRSVILSKINLQCHHVHHFCDLLDSTHPDRLDPLLYALRNFGHTSLDLTNPMFDYLIRYSNLLNTDGNDNRNALMCALIENNRLKLSSAQFDYLIYNSDLAHLSKDSENALLLAAKNAVLLPEINWDYLIDNSDPTVIDKHGDSVLIFLAKLNENNLLNKIFDNLGLSSVECLEPYIEAIHRSYHYNLTLGDKKNLVIAQLTNSFERYFLSVDPNKVSNPPRKKNRNKP